MGTASPANVAALLTQLQGGPVPTDELRSRLGLGRSTVYSTLQLAKHQGLICSIRPTHPLWPGDQARKGKALKVWALASERIPTEQPEQSRAEKAASAQQARELRREASRHLRKERRAAARQAAARAAQAKLEVAVFEVLFDATTPLSNAEIVAACGLPLHQVAKALLSMLTRGEVRYLTPMAAGYPTRLNRAGTGGNSQRAWVITRTKPAAPFQR